MSMQGSVVSAQWEAREEPGTARRGGTCLPCETSGRGGRQIYLGISWKVVVVVVMAVVLVWFDLKGRIFKLFSMARIVLRIFQETVFLCIWKDEGV